MDKMLQQGDKISIIACSNGLLDSQSKQIENLYMILKKAGLILVLSPYVYRQESVFATDAKNRAKVLMDSYNDNEIKAIFDVSGGNIANEILDLLDYDLIKRNPKPFWGYSDLTTVINALYHQIGQCDYLYQIRNILLKQQYDDFNNSVFLNQNDLYDFSYCFIQQTQMSGVVIGGNIRCFLKLAGTKYLPDFSNRILFLESYSGDVALMTTYLTQLKQMGVFQKISGLLLGTFTEMERNNEYPDIVALATRIINDKNLAIAKTDDIGHSRNSKCLIIGKEYRLKK